jgi:hypothetical protein
MGKFKLKVLLKNNSNFGCDQSGKGWSGLGGLA